MSQLSIAEELERPMFDAALAAAAAREGMARAERAERVQLWKQAAIAWLERLPAGTELTADDVIAALGLPDPESAPARNNVIGAWFSHLSRAGRVTWTGTFRKSERVVGHGNLQRVWRTS